MSFVTDLFKKKTVEVEEKEEFVPLEEVEKEEKKAISLKYATPLQHNEATEIADCFLAGSVVCIDLGAMEKENAVRLTDFLAGIVYAKNGAMKKTGAKTLLLAPEGIDLADVDEMI